MNISNLSSFSTILLIAVVGGCLACIFAYLYLFFIARRHFRRRFERYLNILPTAANGSTLSATDIAVAALAARSFSERILRPTWKKMTIWVQTHGSRGLLTRLQTRLERAGKQRLVEDDGTAQGYTPADVLVLKGVLAIVIFLFGILTMGMVFGPKGGSSNIIYAVVCLTVGFMIPDLLLRSTAKKRAALIRTNLPDFIELLTVSIDAGNSLNQGIAGITRRQIGPLRHEFSIYLRQQRLGVPTAIALTALVERTGYAKLSMLTELIVQAQDSGGSIAHTLRVMSADLRLEQRMSARTQAHKATIKMLIPMVGCIFPSLFIVLLGPAVPQLMGGMK